MHFRMDEAIEVLERTPQTLAHFLSGLSDPWVQCHEGEGTWTATEVIEHLIENEKTNWLPRIETILQEGERNPFPPFDRFAHLHQPSGKPIAEKIQEFKTLRLGNTTRLRELVQTKKDLELTGTHPVFGVVKMRELLSTWVVHDLTHIAQIVRVMANRYKDDVGPWIEYLGILKK